MISEPDPENIEASARSLRSRLYALTGFKDKTLWDWLLLFIVPVVLGFGVVVFNYVQSKGEKSRAATKELFDQNLAADRENEEALQNYFDRMTDLLFDQKLRESNADSVSRNVARARTVTTISQLDAARKAELIIFLKESGLIDVPALGSGAESIVSLAGAALSGVDFAGRDISDANLSYAQMSQADMPHANLSNSSFECSGLSGAGMFSAIAINANFKNAGMRGVTASAINFTGANLDGAILREADLKGSDFTSASLVDAILTEADLTRATISNEQLAHTFDLVDAILPNGTVMTPELWPKFKDQYGGGAAVVADSSPPSVKDFFAVDKSVDPCDTS